jgi:Zn-dependent protease/CBS domain-containing protein
MNAFRLGRLFGIDVRIDYSWLFVFVLLTWNLAAVFSVWHPDWTPLEAVGIAATAAVLFFACVLLHELAHSLVARRFGLRVRSITLFLFGGISNIEREPPSARAEFLTAIAGPIVSLVLGFGFITLTSLSVAMSYASASETGSALSHLGPGATLLAWLGPINVLIGAFNLIPAFPLDGGRVLRSVLWASSRDLSSATRTATTVGQAFGGLFIVVGIAMAFGLRVPFFGTGLVGGLWLAFIGWFLRRAAAQSYLRVALHDVMEGHTVAELMRPAGESVPPDLSLAALVHEYLIPSDAGALPIVQDGKVVGVVSLTEVRRVPHDEWSRTPVERVMRRDAALTVAEPGEPLAQAFEDLARQDLGELPVLDHGRLVGMLLRRDLGRWFELAWSPGGARA